MIDQSLIVKRYYFEAEEESWCTILCEDISGNQNLENMLIFFVALFKFLHFLLEKEVPGYNGGILIVLL